MNKFKKAFTAFISILLVLSMIVPVSALEGFDGTGGNGSSGTTGSDWNIPNGYVERSAIVGYRFTVVRASKSGTTYNWTLRGHSIDVYSSKNEQPVVQALYNNTGGYTIKSHLTKLCQMTFCAKYVVQYLYLCVAGVPPTARRAYIYI